MCRGRSYDVVPTPLPLSQPAVVRPWRASDTGEPLYSVPVRLTDSGAVVYDNQDTLDRLRLRGRSHTGHPWKPHSWEPPGVPGGLWEAPGGERQVPVGDGRIMRFVELRQVRGHDDLGRQSGFRSSEDRYVVATPTVDDRPPPDYCHRRDQPEVVYVNVEKARQPTVRGPIVEEDTEHWPPESTSSEAAAGQDSVEHAYSDSVEESREEAQADEDSGVSCPADFRENDAQETKESHEEGTASRPKAEAGDGSASRSRPRRRTPPDAAARARGVRLADAYLLRMSPPPPSSHPADGRRRAAYSDPVRWVSPVSGQQRQQVPETTPSTRPAGGRPNGLRAPPTSEALNEAIRRRNRKCKPSAMRRLQAAAKPAGGAGAASEAAADCFEPIFEGVSCSLRTRSASLSDCNALAKSRDHAINF